MSEHNPNISIKEIYSQKEKGITSIHVIDSENKTYIVYIDKNTISVVSTEEGKVDQKEIIKFAADFMKEITSTETQKDA